MFIARALALPYGASTMMMMMNTFQFNYLGSQAYEIYVGLIMPINAQKCSTMLRNSQNCSEMLSDAHQYLASSAIQAISISQHCSSFPVLLSILSITVNSTFTGSVGINSMFSLLINKTKDTPFQFNIISQVFESQTSCQMKIELSFEKKQFDKF